MLKKMGLVMVALVMVLAACGDDGGFSAEEQAKIDEIVGELTEDTSAANPFAAEEDASCFAEGIMGDIGLERINELDTGAGLEAGFADMTTAEQESIVDSALGCIDFPAYMSEQLATAGLTEDQASCVSEGLDEDLIKTLFLAQIAGQDPTTSEELMTVVMGCLMG